MTEFRGLYPPLITPFDGQGDVDEQALRDHVDFMIANGVDGMCAGSSTGEFSTMDRDEWAAVLQTTVNHVNGRVPALAGTAALSTAETVDRSRFAEALGYDGLLIISPWYQVHTDRELLAHFDAIRNAVNIPVMIYNNPPVTGMRLSVELLETMARHDLIQYLKDADSDPVAFSRLRLRLGDKLHLFYGHDNNPLGAFAVGATGWVSGTANFDPDRWSRLMHAALDGDFATARRIWYEILPFIELTQFPGTHQRADWIAVIKRGMELRGRKAGTVRPPMLPLTEEIDKKVQAVVGTMSFAETPPAPSPAPGRPAAAPAVACA